MEHVNAKVLDKNIVCGNDSSWRSLKPSINNIPFLGNVGRRHFREDSEFYWQPPLQHDRYSSGHCFLK